MSDNIEPLLTEMGDMCCSACDSTNVSILMAPTFHLFECEDCGHTDRWEVD